MNIYSKVQLIVGPIVTAHSYECGQIVGADLLVRKITEGLIAALGEPDADAEVDQAVQVEVVPVADPVAPVADPVVDPVAPVADPVVDPVAPVADPVV